MLPRWLEKVSETRYTVNAWNVRYPLFLNRHDLIGSPRQCGIQPYLQTQV